MLEHIGDEAEVVEVRDLTAVYWDHETREVAVEELSLDGSNEDIIDCYAITGDYLLELKDSSGVIFSRDTPGWL